MLSIVVSWRDRAELGQSLPTLLAVSEAVGGDVTVVNFGGDRALLDPQVAPYRERIRIVEVHGEKYFNKAAAQNVGAWSTQQPLLFFCDCDILLDLPSTVALVKRLAAHPGCFGTLAGVRESELNSRGANHVVSFGYELKIRTADGRQLNIIDNEEDSGDGTRQAPGLLFVYRKDFEAINGYNAGLHGWGWEDQDMISRLTLGNGLVRISDGSAIHISHGDEARIGAYPPVSSRWESRDRMFRTALANYDAANFDGTFAQDVERLASRAIRMN
ncbi:galactosyltransferase-related protein [Stenotrophomonas indicatrix]|uniref:galactosyltransferase-related protein n=1 Tax=Stenotrophomonas indicatrix TaxID=2045451 RepID=UPI0028B016A5|nr:galactosyltransferase-related protein [Stenotrophomonas indicatrix]